MTSTPPPFDPGRPGESGAPYSFAKPETPPYGATPPPPPPVTPAQPVVTAPPVAWLVPIAGLLALIGAFIPWFQANGTLSRGGQVLSHDTFDPLYSWKDGKIGLVAPILLVVLSIVVIGLLRGRQIGRLGRTNSPVTSTGWASAGGGAATIVCAIIAWFLVTSQYKITLPGIGTYGWDELIEFGKSRGVDVELSRGPQVGYWLTIVAGVLAIAGGIAMVISGRKAEAAAASRPGAPAPPAFGAAPQQGPYAQPGPSYGQHDPQGRPGGYGQAPGQPGAQPGQYGQPGQHGRQ